MTKKGKRAALLQRDGLIDELQVENERLKARLAEYEKRDGVSRPGERPARQEAASAAAAGGAAPGESDEARLYRLLADNATDVIWTVDADLRVTYVSPSVTRVLGYSPGEIKGKSFTEIVPPASLGQMTRLNAEDMSAEARQPGSLAGRVADFELLARDGSPVWVEAVISPLRDAEGRWAGFQGACREATQRRKAQLALAASEERFRTIFERSPIGVVVYDADGVPLEVNQACFDIFGISREGIAGGPSLFEYRLLRDDGRMLRAGETITVELPVDLDAARESGRFSTDKSGTLWVRLIAVPIGRRGDGSPGGYLGLVEDVTRRKQMEEALRISEERNRLLVDNANEAITIIQDGAIRFLNPKLAEFSGYTASELLGRQYSDLVYPGDLEMITDRYVRRMAGEDVPHVYQFRIVDRAGNTKWAEINAVLVDWEGRPATLALMNDITARREAEDALRASEERLRQVTENMLDAVSLLDRDGTIRYASPSHERIVGYRPDELVGKTTESMFHPEDLERVVATLQGMGDGEVSGLQYRFRHRDGHYMWGEASAKAILDEDGAVTGCVIASHDITKRREAEEALQRQERFFRAVTENSSDGILVMGRDGNVTYESPGAMRLLGLSRSRTGQSATGPIHPDDLAAAAEVLDRVLAGQPSRAELRAGHADGSWRTIDCILVNLLDDPAVEGVVVNIRDVTERKRAEESLRVSEERNRVLVENANEAITVIQNGAIRFVNPKFAELTGYGVSELLAKPYLDLVYPGDREMIADYYVRRLAGEEVPHIYQFRFVDRAGSTRWAEMNAVLMDWEGRRATMGLINDITARRKAEDALRASEEKLRQITENMLDAVALLDKDGVIRYASPSHERIVGYRPEDLVGRPSLDLTHPDDVGGVVAALQGIAEGGVYGIQYRFRHRDGHYIWGEASAKVILDDHGAVTGYVIASHDITERHQAEEALQRQERFFRAVIENSADGIMVAGRDGRLKYESPGASRLLGLSEERTGQRMLEPVHPDDQAAVGEALARVLAGEPVRAEVRAGHVDGTWRNIDCSMVNLLDDPAVEGIVVNARDTTEQKAAEAALRASEERNRLLVDNANESIAVVQDGVVKFANPKLLEVSGYTMEEMASRPFVEMVHPDDRQTVAGYHSGRMQNGDVPASYELRTIASGGDIRWAELRAAGLQWEGRPATLALMHDITERKKAEEDLRESEARLRREEHLFRMLTESSHDLVVLINPDGTIRYESPAVESILGFRPEERIGASVFEHLHPDDAPRVAASFANLKEDPRLPAERYEIRLRHRDGSWRTIDAMACVIPGEGAGVEGVMVNLRDITHRKQAEEALREAKEYAEYVIGTANVLVVVLDTEGRATLLNEAGEKITGYSRAEVVGQDWFELMVPRRRYPQVREEFERVRTEGAIVETFENPILTRAGEERIISWKNSVLVRNGRVAGTLSFGIDVTQRKRAEEALRQAHAELEARVEQRTAELQEANQQLVEEVRQRQQAQDRLQESEARYRGLVESANSIIMELDTRGKVTFFNRFAQEFYGFEASEILGRPMVGTIAPPVDAAGHDTRAAVRDLVRHPQQWSAAEGEGMRRNGERVWISWTNTGLYDSAGRLRNVLCIGMDRTEQRRTSDLLAEQLKEKAAAEERQRLARELHDAVTQMLFSASIIAGVLPRLWERDQEEARRRLNELRQLTRGALAEMRLLLLELRPAAMAEVGLADLLRHLAEATSGRSGFPVSFSIEGQCTVPPDVQMALYRVAQEALANATKHSRATEARVQLLCGRQSASLVVSDNGCGFDLKRVSPEHLGLRIMQERAEAAGAELTVASSKRRGTQVTVSWSGSRRKERG